MMRDCYHREVINKGHRVMAPDVNERWLATGELGPMEWYGAMLGRCMLDSGHTGSHRPVYKHVEAATMNELNEMCHYWKSYGYLPSKPQPRRTWKWPWRQVPR